MAGIILVGEPGSGKSTIANELCKALGWEKVSFAGPLKAEVALALAAVNNDTLVMKPGYPPLHVRLRAEMDDPTTKDRYRGILQWWGTEYRRAQNPNYWINRFEHQIRFGATGASFVVDDCRFTNEYELLKRYKFVLVRLESGETTRPVQEHASEIDWKTWTPDLVLSYEAGPEHQAKRLIEALELS